MGVNEDHARINEAASATTAAVAAAAAAAAGNDFRGS